LFNWRTLADLITLSCYTSKLYEIIVGLHQHIIYFLLISGCFLVIEKWENIEKLSKLSVHIFISKSDKC